MSILMLQATRDTLLADAAKCDSRSLFFDRFADPAAKEDERNAWFKKAIARKPSLAKLGAWNAWLGSAGLKSEEILFAKLQARLMVNMAGGVMENAGICLDRFGAPYIPGTAVKGCARRMAIQNLLEARETQEPSDRLARLLADIALVFGWGEQEWSEKKKDGKFISDFAFAVGVDRWREVSSQARSRLSEANHFGGMVSFLPAFPYQLPAPDLELDIVTGHHQAYYADNHMPVALDTEDPNPVMFPAAAANIIFQFVVLPLPFGSHRDSFSQPGAKLHGLAFEWLRQGSETFGLGAKTAAGYGWFDASETFNTEFARQLGKQAGAAAEQAAKDRRRSSLTPDDAWLAQFKSFPEARRREVINKFAFDDERWWPIQGELADERIQFSLLHFLLKIEPDFLAADRASSKSKTTKALAGLRRKFPPLAGTK